MIATHKQKYQHKLEQLLLYLVTVKKINVQVPVLL